MCICQLINNIIFAFVVTAHDAKHLGFLPHDMDVTELKPVLKTILKEGLVEAGSNLHDRRRNLMAISNELNEVFFQYPFRLVPR